MALGIFIRRDDPAQRTTWFPADRNVRVRETMPSQQQSPDPPRQGDIVARPAVRQVFTSFYDTDVSVQEDRFVAGHEMALRQRNTPQGRQSPWEERANIVVPPYVAYGSLFTADTQTYGYG